MGGGGGGRGEGARGGGMANTHNLTVMLTPMTITMTVCSACTCVDCRKHMYVRHGTKSNIYSFVMYEFFYMQDTLYTNCTSTAI